ncbi:hypothetical protein AB6A40_007994 [Gnathostoma spinigerum]|uniref:Reverse transcriptase n=1 Tax=Gnathostoma spinigerum TaxID=75299 RepID=A0ABD6EYF6_9BILA
MRLDRSIRDEEAADIAVRDGRSHQGRRIGEVLERYAAIFTPSLEHCNKIRAHLELKQDTQPVFREPPSVAFALREAVEEELQRRVGKGGITPVERDGWTVARKKSQQQDEAVGGLFERTERSTSH